MADVTLETRGNRGQLFLVTALTLAVLFVGLALLLNTAIFTENLATRGTTPNIQDVTEYRVALNDVTVELIRQANYGENGTGYDDLHAVILLGQADWENAMSRNAALRGRMITLDRAGSVNGTRIVQPSDGNFTNRNGDATWIVVDEAEGIRHFRLNVSKDDLVTTTIDSLDSAFNVSFERGGQTWNVSIYEDSGETKVVVVPPTGSPTACPGPAAANHTLVDLSGAAVNGTDCSALKFVGSGSGETTVRFVNAKSGGTDTVKGIYELFVNGEYSAVDGDGSDLHADGGPSPMKTTAIYSVNVSTGYYTSRLNYSTEFRSVPSDARNLEFAKVGGGGGGGGGGGSSAPNIDTFDIDDKSSSGGSGKAQYQLTWAVSDPDSDIDSVTVYVNRTGDGNQAVYQGASSTENFGPQNGEAGSDYEIKLIAVDRDGNEICQNTTDIADGTDPSVSAC